ncbi:hypothetical protein NKR23_g7511 [Pleurostoma richardsiae]|uniref:Carboxylesterase family protein n=1 Tax=Pleurostoma richardsiae TaxID=41990 RepID=A0AA38VDD3_9PEZI|nr:hypothetical protein NKR23_g7511 [Pleurostoma richardsiae]
MAPLTRSRTSQLPGIHEDSDAGSVPTAEVSPVSDLTVELKKFHLHERPKNASVENDVENASPNRARRLQARPSIDPDTFSATGAPQGQEGKVNDTKPEDSQSRVPGREPEPFEDPVKYNSLEIAAGNLLHPLEQIANHEAATPIEVNTSSEQESAATEQQRMAPVELTDKPAVKPETSDVEVTATHDAPIVRQAVRSAADSSDDSYVEIITHRPPVQPLPRIEDSFEALDQFEEQVEAVTAAAQLHRVFSPDGGKAAAGNTGHATTKSGANKSSSTAKKTMSKQGSVRSSLGPGRTSSVRRTAASTSSADGEKAMAKAPNKKPVPRPASLAPPKPLAKATRPPILPTFELPGEAVARKLKEQRQARLSMQPEQMTAAVGAPQRSKSVRSSKAPTIPTFELPGEAISRRKREEHAAKLKAQEEAERQRREFKAKPIRASLGPSTLVRETVTSRARTAAKTMGAASQGEAGSSHTTKRQSIAPGTFSRPSLFGTPLPSSGPPSRGRGSELGSPSAAQVSRATSSSTGSTCGKARSAVSAEDAHQQKLRGKEILKRDNILKEEREREKREREMAAKIARQEAAERSRALSREWAEKQRLKKTKLSGTAAAVAVTGASA